MHPRLLPLPKELIDEAPESLVVPCLDCPHLHTFNSGKERIWIKGRCRKKWLPTDVTMAALTKHGVPWGMEIRKLAGLCPYYNPGHVRLFTVYLVVDEREKAFIDDRVALMLETLPLWDIPVVASKSWT